MKNIWILLILLLAGSLHAQTMKWVPLPKGTSAGKCVCAAPTKSNLQCFALEYTPKVTGILTSYTTLFFVSCTSKGSPISENQACYMVNKVDVIDGCDRVGKLRMVSSGNSGSGTNSYVEADKPIFVHQVCFNIPAGETITIEKQEGIQFTTSVDLAIGKAVTEFPEYITQTVTNPKYDMVSPTEWLDIKTAAAGDHKTQIDWSVSTDRGIDHFEVEHTMDGVHFKSVGQVKADPTAKGMRVYQFTHPNAGTGKNYYRIQLIHVDDKTEYSPVRTVSFDAQPFTVHVSPNPATDFINVKVSGQKEDYIIWMYDAAGKLVLEQKPDVKTTETRLKVDGLNAGVYTVQVKCGEELFTEKVAVAK